MDMQDTLLRYTYTQQEEDAVTREIAARFGRVDQVLRDAAPDAIRVDICAVPGEEGTTLVTRGMGARPMQVPGELQGYDRAELTITLPPGWDLDSRDERMYWPLRWLKLLARLPGEEGSWLGWGHTVPGGEPFADNTGFDSLLLLDSGSLSIPTGNGLSSNGEHLQLYRLFPLYPAELRYKLENGAQALVDRLEREGLLGPLLDIARPGLFSPRAEEKDLLRDWTGPDRCLATERILADGAPVGYCYREAPCGDWDSGWRFTAGDESDAYMDDPACSGVHGLNDIAGRDPDILAILQTPAPCAFARGAGGLERLKTIL